MKKIYKKPALVKRERLSAVVAVTGSPPTKTPA
ncbi:putative RiPP precursor [Mesorhizobium ciceri]|nr:putative RiPP precursor [Mesorhizobium ciceri]